MMVFRARRNLLLASAVSICVLVAGGSALAAERISNPWEIRLGIVAPLTGPVPSFGMEVRNGVLLAVQEWNDRGGVGGKKIVTFVEDGQCNATVGPAAAQKLIGTDDVRYMIGEVCSAASIPISEIANAARIIQITPTSTNPKVTVDASGAVKAYIFRNCFIDPYQGIVGARFAFNSLGARTAFVMGDMTDGYVSSLRDSFAAAFTKLGGTIVGKGDYTEGSDFTDILARIREANPAVVYLPDYYNAVNVVVRQARAKGITIPFIGGDGWDSADLDLEATEGCYFVNHFSDLDARPEVSRFIANYERSFPDQEPASGVRYVIAALSYDAANMLFQAIQTAGRDDTAQVGRALESMHFQGVTGELTFDRSHNPQKSAFIFAIKDHAVRFLTRIDP